MQVTLKLRDQLSAESTQALDKVVKGARATGVAVTESGKATREAGRAAVEAGKATVQAANAATEAHKQTSAAVSQEAAATTRASQATRQYAEDCRVATARGKEMAEAWTALGHKERNVLGLVGRLKQVDQYARQAEKGLSAAASAGGRLGQAVAQGGAALAAGGYVAGRALATPISFEKRLADMANTAYNDRGVEGRRAGGVELRAAIKSATDQYGGSRDEAAEALDKMLASGAVKPSDAIRMLPELQKAATASGAGTGDLADIAIRGVQQGFFKPNEVGVGLDKAIIAGQKGGFELKDMLFRSGIYCRNGGRIHVDGLGKAGAFGNLTPYSLIPVRLRASIAPRRHAQFVLSAAGAAGGIRASRDEGVYVAGHAGAAAGTMQTGGGGGGAVNTLPGDFGGAGGAGGPLCGGAASGGGHNAGGGAISADAGAYGGPGTKGRGVSATYSASSGAGNPPGGADTYCEAALLGGGGLLALFSPAIDIDSGCICSADGAQGGLMASPGYWHFPGGSAGGGLVCAATRPGGWRNRGTVRALGGAAVPGCQGLYNGGPGGAGSVNIFEV